MGRRPRHFLNQGINVHIPHHQELLRRAKGDTLDAAIKQIRAENPAAFHIEETSGDNIETLSSRVFFNQPIRNERAKGFVQCYVAAGGDAMLTPAEQRQITVAPESAEGHGKLYGCCNGVLREEAQAEAGLDLRQEHH